MDWASRYSTPLAEIFTRGHKLGLEHRVELALLKALGDMDRIPKEAYLEAKAAVDGERQHCLSDSTIQYECLCLVFAQLSLDLSHAQLAR